MPPQDHAGAGLGAPFRREASRPRRAPHCASGPPGYAVSSRHEQRTTTILGRAVNDAG
jgi:hypothetical protein